LIADEGLEEFGGLTGQFVCHSPFERIDACNATNMAATLIPD
jgi:hypothetical protein